MITFAEALEQTRDCKRYLLLGNGFSISLFPRCFTYASLFEEARDSGLFKKAPELESAFDLLKTVDFEFVMEALKAASALGVLYGYDGMKMKQHADMLKEILVEAIAGRHPSRPSDISEDNYRNCRAFLAEFIGVERDTNRGRVFTLNYDLLLYWSVLHDIISLDWEHDEIVENPDQTLLHDDGFRAPEDDPNASYVAWEQFGGANGQSITFLHGALHLYERGPELAKLCWERSGNNPLMDQIRAALDDNRYPLFVSEGTTEVKLRRINRSAYLSKGLRSFAGCCGTKNAAMFVIGHSLADNDEHVLKRIRLGKIGRLYVSLFGDPESVSNKAIRAKAESMAAARPERAPLAVEFIDAATLHIWEH